MLDLRRFPWLQMWNRAKGNPLFLSLAGHFIFLIVFSLDMAVQKKEKIITVGAVRMVSSNDLQKIIKTQKSSTSYNKLDGKKAAEKNKNIKKISKDFSKLVGQVKKQQEEKSKEQFETILKDIKKKKNGSDAANKLEKSTKSTKTDSQNVDTGQISGDDELEIKRQIYPKWSIPAGIKNAESYYVDVEVALAADGRVMSAKVVNSVKGVELRVVAESAVRAVLLASPIRLKSKGRPSSRKFVLRFDLKEALL